MWKKAPARFNNISSNAVENAENEYVEDDDSSPVAKGQNKKRKLDGPNDSEAGSPEGAKDSDAFTTDAANATFGDDAEDAAADVTLKAPESARKTMAAKFKSLHSFKNKDDFLELLVGHSYSNKYSCYHNAVHQCIVHEDFEGFPCEHQFRICERTDDKGEKVYDLQERGVHSTVLKLDRTRGVHPLMIMDVDEMLMSQVPPSQIIKTLKQKYEGQPDMLALIPKKTKVISRKITAKVKGPMKRTTFAYTPPMSTAVRPTPVKATPLTSGELHDIHALTEGEYKLSFNKPGGGVGVGGQSSGGAGGVAQMYSSNYAMMSSEFMGAHLPDSGSSSDEEDDVTYIAMRQPVLGVAGGAIVGTAAAVPNASLVPTTVGGLDAAIPDSL